MQALILFTAALLMGALLFGQYKKSHSHLRIIYLLCAVILILFGLYGIFTFLI